MQQPLRTLVCALGAAAATYVALPSLAAAQDRVIVLGLDGDVDMLAEARTVTAALREAYGAIANRRIVGRDVRLEELLTTHACTRPDDRCLARVALDLEVDRIVFGAVRPTDNPGEISVMLFAFEAYSSRRVARITQVLPPEVDAPTLAARAHEWAQELDVARVVAPVAQTASPAGEQRAAATASRPTPNTSATTMRVVGWSVMGAAAVTLVLTIVAAREVVGLNDDPAFLRYRETVPAGTDACDAARMGIGDAFAASAAAGVCHDADVLSTLQWVGLGSAVFFAGVASYLLLAPPDEQQPRSVEVSAAIGPGTAAVSGTIRF